MSHLKTIDCPNCGGTGEEVIVTSEGTVIGTLCTICNGKGTVLTNDSDEDQSAEG